MSNDDFFSRKRCARCGNDLSDGRIMSMFNQKCICMECSVKERKHADYAKAVAADHDAIRSGNYNFRGIGYRKGGIV